MDVRRFNSVEPTMNLRVDPNAEPTRLNIEEQKREVRLDVGRFNSVEPSKPSMVPRLNQLIRCRIVIHEDLIPQSGSSP